MPEGFHRLSYERDETRDRRGGGGRERAGGGTRSDGRRGRSTRASLFDAPVLPGGREAYRNLGQGPAISQENARLLFSFFCCLLVTVVEIRTLFGILLLSAICFFSLKFPSFHPSTKSHRIVYSALHLCWFIRYAISFPISLLSLQHWTQPFCSVTTRSFFYPAISLFSLLVVIV